MTEFLEIYNFDKKHNLVRKRKHVMRFKIHEGLDTNAMKATVKTNSG